MSCAHPLPLAHSHPKQFSYPVRLRRVLILTAPLWFRASFRMLRGFIQDQLRDKVNVLRPSPGTKLDALSHPDFVTLRRDHYAWLQTALVRTGWLLGDPDQLVKPNGHKPQSAAAFFGQSAAHNISGSSLDLSDTESRDDEESLSGNPIEEDDMTSLSDMDPFALSSSYSSETDGTDAESRNELDGASVTDCRDTGLYQETGTQSHPLVRESRGSISPRGRCLEHSRVNRPDHSISATEPTNVTHDEHAGTPTPPSVVKRIHLTNEPVILPAGSAPVARPRTVNTSSDRDMGFSENSLSPLAVESTTPTADVLPGPISLQDPVDVIAKTNTAAATVRYRNSAGANSSCSSTTSFFSTGSAGLSSAPSTRSADCSPTGDQLFQRVALFRAGSAAQPKSEGVLKLSSGTGDKHPHYLYDGMEFCELSKMVSVSNGLSAQSVDLLSKRVAPLAEDEIGEHTIKQDKHRDRMSKSEHSMSPDGDNNSDTDIDYPGQPPTEDDPPSWAVGRPHGLSIHQGPKDNESLENDIITGYEHEDNQTDATNSTPPPMSTSPGRPLASISENTPSKSDSVHSVYSFHPILSAGSTSSVVQNENVVLDHQMKKQLDRESISMEDEADHEDDTVDDDDDSNDGDDLDNHDQAITEGDVPEEDDDLYEISQDSDSDITDKFSLGDYWFTADQLVQHVVNLGVTGLHTEYNAVVRIKSDDPRSAFKHLQNREKNRYCDVVCYESSRVHLRPLSLQVTLPETAVKVRKLAPNSKSTPTSVLTSTLHRTQSAPLAAKDLVRNYIHANWVDGYRQKNAFICTQGPLSETAGDFWRMVWDYHVPIIVMITKVYEAQRSKCYPYWPETVHRKLYFSSGHAGTMPSPFDSTQQSGGSASNERPKTDLPHAEFEVENVSCRLGEHFACSTLRLTHMPSGRRRTVEHFAYFSWPDHGVPSTTTGLQQLLASVQDTYMKAIRHLGFSSPLDQAVPPPPVVVHCSAGIGRTGTYVTADICTKRLIDPVNDDKSINIPLTVSRVRSQRCGCVQVAAQYVFCYRVLIDFAVQHGLLDNEPDSITQTALELLKPSPTSHHADLSGFGSIPPMFYHSTSLPRTGHQSISSTVLDPDFPVPSGLSATLAEFRNLLPTTQLLSIWHAMKSKRDQDGGAQALASADFIMTENTCSESNSDADDLADSYGQESPRAIVLSRVCNSAAEHRSPDIDSSSSHSNGSSISSHNADTECHAICIPCESHSVCTVDEENEKRSVALDVHLVTDESV
ncbi:Protein tyrosine phosphatase n9 [Fasciola gigantica]|uniref:Protein tyrosine phosphatase n9 n=1 Tax=Fasciola gigantica TaxID=46835 RepID=A0A504YPD3_FASGI|nr:Protein tyrosine phosphatase n9 [Fasciola gigantica]